MDLQELLKRAVDEFVRYMDMFPGEKRNGLWTVVGRILDKQVDVNMLRMKYKNVQRVII